MSRTLKKLIHEEDYIAEVVVTLEESADEWAPYISLRDALRIDDVREALQRGDVNAAAEKASVFEILPVHLKVAEAAGKYNVGK